MDKGCEIRDLECYLPERRVTNEDIMKDFPAWSPEVFEKTVGVKCRHVAAPGETAADMAMKAAVKLLERVDRSDVDFTILCTQYPDYYKPTTACLLQKKLGLRNDSGAYDINLGCSGFVYGLALAKALIAGDIARNVLLLTSTCASQYIYHKDRAKQCLFGDGASATLVSKSEKNKIFSFEFGTDGNNKVLVIPNGAFRRRYDFGAPEIEYEPGSITTDNHLQMDGHEIMNFTLIRVPPLIRNILEKNGLKLEEIDHFIFHQANPFILEHVRRRCGIPAEKFFNDIVNTGNTGSSSIPLGIKSLLMDKKATEGQKLLLAGFGVGLSWAATVIEL
jgi:3-oxoacyl-[acyl-carrier-protein] synthase III